ncbi:hypothetical protein AQUCO_08300029v1 [Aquilegia coerulea]|uniref:F-box protein GID2 n=1 Tax=Aquilegia coerulea TaxID=218851 RepID=A0A2G5C709_AQUCA|nr:hypothetical protein AQUCO_08300029v1 [Aquilegia coerulea]
MKRPLEENLTVVVVDHKKKKKIKNDEEEKKKKKIKNDEEEKKKKKIKIDEEEGEFVNLDEDLLFEVFKHVDAKSLASAACVSKQWNKTAQDERLWEMICTRHWASKTGCSTKQLRSVVLALGGFQCLHSHSLWPLSKPPSSSSSSAASSSAASSSSSVSSSPSMPTHWGKDEVNLSLSLLSIRFYKNMTPMPPRRHN